MCSRFAHCETTVDRQLTVFPLLCVGLLVEVILKLQAIVWMKSLQTFHNVSLQTLVSFYYLFVLVFKLIK
jgi:hypothetical protein